MKYIAKVDNGKLKIVHRALFDNELQQFEGKDVIITIEKKKKYRSSPQNRYFHAILKIVRAGLRDAGFNEVQTDEDVKWILKGMFLKVKNVNSNGEFIERIRHTSELSTSEFMEFIAEIQQWGAEFLNIIIPDPETQTELYNE